VRRPRSFKDCRATKKKLVVSSLFCKKNICNLIEISTGRIYFISMTDRCYYNMQQSHPRLSLISFLTERCVSVSIVHTQCTFNHYLDRLVTIHSDHRLCRFMHQSCSVHDTDLLKMKSTVRGGHNRQTNHSMDLCEIWCRRMQSA
jgi:hypothetical protein